ncbi:MAG: hypothetical protein M0T74_03840, partial [Desulfitobacterium hafniense]|nr:hypothetical protein [Desulfitobacterium hafniense]
KSYKSKSIAGKSVVFLIVVIIGYIAGILHKIFYQYDNVIYLYVLNLLMVSTDLGLFIRNSRLLMIKNLNTTYRTRSSEM